MSTRTTIFSFVAETPLSSSPSAEPKPAPRSSLSSRKRTEISDMEENKASAGAATSEKCQTEVKDSQSHDEHLLKDFPDASPGLAEGELVDPGTDSESGSAVGDVNMEATITSDDVERAGGFGATDDISSLLPVAIDSTDFEASLLNAREFEEPQGEISRPGLGWTEVSEPRVLQ